MRYRAASWSVRRYATPTSGADSLKKTLQAAARRCGDGPQWFAHWPNPNIGVVTGGISDLIVFDVDPKHGSDGSLAAVERRFGAPPELWNPQRCRPLLDDKEAARVAPCVSRLHEAKSLAAEYLRSLLL